MVQVPHGTLKLLRDCALFSVKCCFFCVKIVVRESCNFELDCRIKIEGTNSMIGT